MTEIEELKEKVKLLKEWMELKEKLDSFKPDNPPIQPYPYYVPYPIYPPHKIYSWINSPEGKEKLNSAYKRTKKIVDELVKSRYVDSETLHRPFNK